MDDDQIKLRRCFSGISETHGTHGTLITPRVEISIYLYRYRYIYIFIFVYSRCLSNSEGMCVCVFVLP